MMQRFNREQQHRIFMCIRFIQDAHKDQMYGDQPYYLHPIEVANTLVNPSFDQYMAALLHDVIEDTSVGETDLRIIYGDKVADAVVLLTKKKNLSYSQNIQRIVESRNVDAIKVKLADNKVNLGNQPKEHNIPKYKKSIKTLTEALRTINREVARREQEERMKSYWSIRAKMRDASLNKE